MRVERETEKQNVSRRRGLRRSNKGESGKSRSNAFVRTGAGIASQVKVVQRQQRQRSHSDAGDKVRLPGRRRWMSQGQMRQCKSGNAEPTAGWGTGWNGSWNNPNYQNLLQQQQENRRP